MKNNPTLEYDFLRREALKHIEQVAGKVWTDYNAHDPGITTLEVLAYSITDLAYRTEQPIENLLASYSGTKNLGQDFYEAHEILINNPLTVKDFRKLLLDLKEVKNVWLCPSKNSELPLYLKVRLVKDADGKTVKEFYLEYNPAGAINPDETPTEEPFMLQGMYEVTLQFAKESLNSRMYEIPSIPGSELWLPHWDSVVDEWKNKTISNVGVGVLNQLQGNYFRLKISCGNSAVQGYISLPYSPQPGWEQSLIGDLTAILMDWKGKLQDIASAVETVKDTFLAHRNLSEDLLGFRAVREQPISLGGKLILDSDADVVKTLAKILFEVEEFFRPTIRFNSLSEMLNKGYHSDALFDGLPLQHGFIEEASLDDNTRKNAVYTSDLIYVMSNVKGVFAIQPFTISSQMNGVAVIENEKNCLSLLEDSGSSCGDECGCCSSVSTAFYKPVLDVNKTLDAFIGNIYKLAGTQVPVGNVDRQAVLTELGQLRLAASGTKISRNDTLTLPTGTDKDTEIYFSLQNDFPLLYGVGESGLSDKATPLRKAQAKQLKGFLLFFEQILADYLAQLSQVREFFSFRDEAPNLINRTYYAQALYETPGASDLLSDYDSGNVVWQNFKNDATNQYRQNIEYSHGSNNSIAATHETADIFLERRNRVLNHLLARFSETFTDYAVQWSILLQGNSQQAQEYLIEDKKNLLKKYHVISRDRGKGFHYALMTGSGLANMVLSSKPDASPAAVTADVWDTNNVPGAQKRIATLLGMKNYKRRFLTPQGSTTNAPGDGITVETTGKKQSYKALFSDAGTAWLCTQNPKIAGPDLLKLAADASSYLLKEDFPGMGLWKLFLLDAPKTGTLAFAPQLFGSKKEAETRQAEIMKFAKNTAELVLKDYIFVQKQLEIRSIVSRKVYITGVNQYNEVLDADLFEFHKKIFLTQAQDAKNYGFLQGERQAFAVVYDTAKRVIGGIDKPYPLIPEGLDASIGSFKPEVSALAEYHKSLPDMPRNPWLLTISKLVTGPGYSFYMAADDGRALLSPSPVYNNQADYQKAFKASMQVAGDPLNFVINKVTTTKWTFDLKDKSGQVLHSSHSTAKYTTKTAAQNDINLIVQLSKRLAAPGVIVPPAFLLRPTVQSNGTTMYSFDALAKNGQPAMSSAKSYTDAEVAMLSEDIAIAANMLKDFGNVTYDLQQNYYAKYQLINPNTTNLLAVSNASIAIMQPILPQVTTALTPVILSIVQVLLPQTITTFAPTVQEEGFHLIEHILLRPYSEKDTLMQLTHRKKAIRPEQCDPYSSVVTYLIPTWGSYKTPDGSFIDRFDNEAFCLYVENVIRMETPVHVYANIVWIPAKPDAIQLLQTFETAWRDFLFQRAHKEGKDIALIPLRKKVIDALERLLVYSF